MEVRKIPLSLGDKRYFVALSFCWQSNGGDELFLFTQNFLLLDFNLLLSLDHVNLHLFRFDLLLDFSCLEFVR